MIRTAIPAALIAYCSCSNDPASPGNGNYVEYTQIDFDAAWSNDGSRIAFIHNDLDADLTGLYLMDSTGGNKTQILQGNVTGPDWSPQDTAIIYEEAGSLFVYSLQSSRSRIVVAGPGAKTGKWDPIQGKLAYIKNSNLIVSNSDGSSPVLLDEGCAWPAWSVGGDYLYYIKSSSAGGGSQPGDSLFRHFFPLNSRQYLMTMSGPDYSGISHLSLSSSNIYFARTNLDASSYIYSAFIVSAPQKIINSLSYSPDYSAETGQLIFTNRTRGDGRLWVKERDGTERRLSY